MELIRISETKLKIMLTPTDMTQFELDGETFGENSQKTHRAFKLLLEEVKRRIGFDTDGREISVQYFPSREGGGEMFLSHHSEAKKSDPPPAPSEENRLAIRQRRNCGGFRRECAYRFSALQSLLAACRRLLKVGYIGESAVYRDRGGRYFLFLIFFSPSPFSIPDEWGFLTEYGRQENATFLCLYLSEHGETICNENAVTKLGTLA